MKRWLSFFAIAAALALLTNAGDAAAKGKGKEKKAVDGSRLFSQNCGYCHGTAGRGDGPNADKLSPRPADLTAIGSSEADIARVVKNGKGSCPSWKASLDDDEVGAVARFAKQLQR